MSRLHLLRAQKSPESFTEDLIDFIPRVTPRWEAPMHLAPYIDLLKHAPGGDLRLVFAAPPQHGKTETTIHAFAWWIKKFPHLRYAYATYSSDRSQRVGRRALAIAQRADVQLVAANMGLWTTPADGQVLWTSVGGGMTGEPIDGCIVIDDPLKDRKEANSPTIRENHKDWFHGVVETRVHPGASVIVMATRWDADDLSGYLVRELGFTYINLRAIAEAERPAGDNRQVGEALWEKHRPLSMLLERKHANEWNFASLYQGDPRPKGGALFQEPTYYKELPERGFKIGYGVDLAYTEKTHADFSVCVEIWAVPPERKSRADVFEPKDWLFYIVNVQRKQVDAPSFTLTLKAAQSTRRGRFYMYGSGTEIGAASFIRSKGIPLTIMDPAGRDKFTRAMLTSELWNLGRILLPEDSEANPWADVFADEVTSFTGVKDRRDDQVDAMVSGIDAMLQHQDDFGLISSGGRYTD
jgi:phage terminase large subunit-like protein